MTVAKARHSSAVRRKKDLTRRRKLVIHQGSVLDRTSSSISCPTRSYPTGKTAAWSSKPEIADATKVRLCDSPSRNYYIDRAELEQLLLLRVGQKSTWISVVIPKNGLHHH